MFPIADAGQKPLPSAPSGRLQRDMRRKAVKRHSTDIVPQTAGLRPYQGRLASRMEILRIAPAFVIRPKARTIDRSRADPGGGDNGVVLSESFANRGNHIGGFRQKNRAKAARPGFRPCGDVR